MKNSVPYNSMTDSPILSSAISREHPPQLLKIIKINYSVPCDVNFEALLESSTTKCRDPIPVSRNDNETLLVNSGPTQTLQGSNIGKYTLNNFDIKRLPFILCTATDIVIIIIII